jgi:hypothetical protein
LEFLQKKLKDLNRKRKKRKKDVDDEEEKKEEEKDGDDEEIINLIHMKCTLNHFFLQETSI